MAREVQVSTWAAVGTKGRPARRPGGAKKTAKRAGAKKSTSKKTGAKKAAKRGSAA